MDMQGDQAVFEDTRCNFHMEFWNETYVNEVGGIRIIPVGRYALNNLRFYKSKQPISWLTKGI